MPVQSGSLPQFVDRDAQMSFDWSFVSITPAEATKAATISPQKETLCTQTDGVWPEPWAAAHNRELWKAGPDGTYAWRDQADGYFE